MVLGSSKWFRLSAEQRVAIAQNNLGNAYGRGEGVRQDNIYAHMWLNVAASSGKRGAAKNRDIVAKRMTVPLLADAQKLFHGCIRKNIKGVEQTLLLKKCNRFFPGSQIVSLYLLKPNGNYQELIIFTIYVVLFALEITLNLH
jgi:TPR repeat protein